MVKKYHYSQFLIPPKDEEKINEDDQKKVVVGYFLHYGNDYIKTAKYLFELSDPSFLDSAGILCHYGIEMLLKACVLWEEEFYLEGHKLLNFVEKIPFLRNELSDTTKEQLKTIDRLFPLRYPCSDYKFDAELNNVDTKDQSKLSSRKGEIGIEEWHSTFAFYQKILQHMPEEMKTIYENLDPTKKGNRILMKKKIEVSVPQVPHRNKK